MRVKTFLLRSDGNESKLMKVNIVSCMRMRQKRVSNASRGGTDIWPGGESRIALLQQGLVSGLWQLSLSVGNIDETRMGQWSLIPNGEFDERKRGTGKENV